MEPKLATEFSHHEYLKAQLREQFPDVDEETLADTLEGETNLNAMLAEVIRTGLDDEAMVAAINARISSMKERALRLNDRANRKRNLVQHVMERAGLKKLTEPDMTVSLRATPAHVTITDEKIIPNVYWMPQPPKLDKNAIKDAIKNGTEIPGALLGNISTTLSVRTK